MGGVRLFIIVFTTEKNKESKKVDIQSILSVAGDVKAIILFYSRVPLMNMNPCHE